MRKPTLPWLTGAVSLALLPLVGSDATAQDTKKNEVVPAYVPGEILIKIKGRTAAAADQHLIRMLEEKYGVMFDLGARPRVWKLPAGLDVDSAIQLFDRSPYKELVEFVEPNYKWSVGKVPNDFGNFNLYGLSKIQAPTAWDRQTGSRSVTVAVIDTGIDIGHPDLSANKFVNPGEIAGNGVDDDGNGFVDDVNGWDFRNRDNNPFDDHGHGTHVAGTIGAEGDNNRGVVGVNWAVQVMGLKFLSGSGRGSTSDAVNALNYIAWFNANSASKVRVVNASWGGGGYSTSLKTAIENCGAVFVAAAGNSRSTGLHYPSSYDSANIISVAATDSGDRLASFSNYHSTRVDLAAPGVSIISTYPSNRYASMSGTSMAAPHVAGVAALVLAQQSSLSNAQVKARILDNVDAVSGLSGRVLTGGRLNANKALPGVAVNQAPTANAGASQTIQLPSSAGLSGSVSDDGLPNPPGAVTTTWSKTSGPGTVTFGDANALSTSASFTAAGTYVLNLHATDSLLSDDAQVTITVDPEPVNQAPSASAGANQSIQLPSSASLNGSVNDDGLPNPPGQVTASWTNQSPSVGIVTFGDASSAATTASFSVAGTYVLRLTADDSALSTFDELTVTVLAAPSNQAPTAIAGTDQTIQLPSSASLSGSVSDDGLPNPPGAVTTTWSETSGPGTVSFGSASSLATTASFSAAGTYVLRLTADDGALSTFDELTVTVQPAPPQNTAPVVSAGPDQSVQLPATASLTGSVTDDGLPSSGTLTSSWSTVSGPGTVTFGNADVPVTTASFTTAGSYVLRLSASDGALSSSDTLTVTVTSSGGGTPVVIASDDFESGKDGGTGWSGAWQFTGDVEIKDKRAHGGEFVLRVKKKDGTATRAVNLSGVTNGKLRFWGMLRSLKKGERFHVRASSNGGSSWSTLKTFTKANSDGKYHVYELPLSGASSNYRIGFFADNAKKGKLYVDDLEVSGTR